MKTIFNTLLLSAVVLCELPPPYQQRGFRASPQIISLFSSSKSPQTQYGPPKFQSPQTQYGPPKIQSPSTQYGPPKIQYPQTQYGLPKIQSPQTQYGPPKFQSPQTQSNTLDVTLPSRLTIEQLIRLTEQLQSSQEKIIIKQQTIQLSTPQNSYLPPPREPETVYGSPANKFQFSQSQLRPPPVSDFGAYHPQRDYRPSQPVQQLVRPSRPQNQYGPPFQTSHTGTASSQGSPHTTYGVPNIPQLSQSGFDASNNQPNPQIPPSTSYGVPDLRSIETLGELRTNQPQRDEDILRQNLLNDLARQHLPYKEPSGFRPQGSPNTEVPSVNEQYLPGNGGTNLPQGTQGAGTGNQGFFQGNKPSTPQTQNVPNVNQQYLPANTGSGGQGPQNGLGGGQQGNVPDSNTTGGTVTSTPQGGRPFGSTPSDTSLTNIGTINIGQNYLPPQSTTPKVTLATRPTTARPRTVATTPLTSEGTTNYDYDYDLQQPTETPISQDGSASDPNVSISNAVAGGGGFFYLQQPDGRLQKVVLQKTQEANSKPEEYIANYYFQNIQAVPAVTYTPLVSLGAWR